MRILHILFFTACGFLTIIGSSSPAWAAARAYVLWQEKPGGPYVVADAKRPVGGTIMVRLVIEPADGRACGLHVTGASITEARNSFHKTRAASLPATFSTANPNPAWRDPTSGAVVMQSTPFSTCEMHNYLHTILMEFCYESDGMGLLQGSAEVEINARNLVVRDNRVDRLLAWNPRDPAPQALSCVLEHAQRGNCEVIYQIYSVVDNTKSVLTKKFRGVRFPGSHSWMWNGETDNGEIAKAGLYICRITAKNAADSRDWDTNYSPYLLLHCAVDENGETIEEAKTLGFTGRDTPDRAYDDFSLAMVSYVLMSRWGKAAGKGEVRFYDPNFRLLAVRDLALLRSIAGGPPLAASAAGVQHSVECPVWAGYLKFDEPCLFVIGCVDDYAGLYKDHWPKPCLEAY